MSTDMRERVARAIASKLPSDFWEDYLYAADAVLAELGLTQDGPVALPDPVMIDGTYYYDALKVQIALNKAAPQPQAEPVAWSAAADWLERESAAVYGVCLTHHAEAANWLREAAPQPQASLNELSGNTGQLPQAGLLEQHARDSAELRRLCEERDRYRNEAKGLRDALTDALEHNESLRLAVSSNPQASAEDVAVLDSLVFGSGLRFHNEAWQRIRADYERMGVK